MNENGKIIESKKIEGFSNPYLHKVTDLNLFINNTRLYLYHDNSDEIVIFGDEISDLISPAHYNYFFQTISKENEFYKYSTFIREQFLALLKLNNLF